VQSNRLATALTVLATLAVALLAATAPSAGAAEFEIGEGQLDWNVKESWRDYVTTGSEVGDGAEITGWLLDGEGNSYAEGFSFPVSSGSFDDETNTTTLRLDGYVHFQYWCGLIEPGKCPLDTKFSDLEIEIGPAGQVLRGTHTGYHRTDPGGEIHVDENVVLAKFDIAGATTSFDAGQSRWSEIPTVAGPGLSIYGESTVLDDTSFEYTGPGGFPDLAEKWDTPGAPGLSSEEAWLADPASDARVLYPSAGDDVVHTVDLAGARTTGARLVIAARDAETMAAVGTPYTWAFPGAVAADRQALRTAFDPATDSVFFATYHDGEARKEITIRRAVWDAGTQSYAVETVGSLGSTFTNTRRVTALAWNPVEQELAAIAYSGSTADPYATDLLHRFRLEGGTWAHAQTSLRLPDTGEWAGATTVVSPYNGNLEADAKALAVARDGTYVSASGAGRTSNAGELHYYPALHIVVGEDGSATVAPIAGTTTPRTAIGTYYGFSSLAADGDGSLLLHNSSQVMDAYVRIDIVAGEAVKVGDIVDAPADAFPPYELAGFANSMAADGPRGLTWATDTWTADGSRLLALEGNEIVGRYVYTDFPEAAAKGAFSRLAVGPDGSVYLPIKDADSGRLGYRRLAYTGVVPEVTTQPQDRSVVLGVGEASEQAEFAVAIADGDDAIQWQSRAPGEAVFFDVAGATAGTLNVAAAPASNGTAYRAKVSNGAGKIVSDVVALDVSYAPLIVSDLANRGVTEGADALFLVGAEGNPEPVVSWQRRVGGFWQSIPADDDNFVVNGPSLTVLDTNLEQSGALFRAKLTNSVAAVFSKTAKLTVTPAVAIPPQGLDLENVSLDWTGNPEMQKSPPFGNSNFFSAGSSNGKEATYEAFADNAAVYQVSAGGGEAPASWATRAAHVANGGKQLVRLYGGDARIEPDGSATVVWDGAFSVNFYGGLVPFTLLDPELTLGADGSGELLADLAGCASSQVNPGECAPLPTAADVTVATFSGVEIDPAGEVSIAPDYAGVEVTIPVPFVPQDRVGAGWGAWPQELVDFHVKTGLSSYWYSSGGAFDPDKKPDPFVVDFAGEALPAEPRPEPVVPPPGPAPKPAAQAGGPTGVGAGTRPAIAAAGKVQLLGRKRAATLATLACPAGGSCQVTAPKRVKLKIAGEPSWARAIVPRSVAAGSGAVLKLKLSRAAVRGLGRKTATGRVKVAVRSPAGVVRRALAVKIRKGGKKGGKKKGAPGSGTGAPTGAGGPQSAPITSAVPTLARPAGAVDVSGVEISWFPRDSWVRYASSGVAAGDGILLANGALGVNSTASRCPDRASTSDAQLPYEIGFTPRASWYDPASGVAGIYGQGSVAFRWAAHRIDLTASDPEIEINGASSRAIFRFSGSGGTPYPDQRAALISLDLSGRPAVSNGGRTFTYSEMRGTLTADGVNVFAGFYTPPGNDEFGCVSVAFTTP
jgi:hypothetical protein